MNGNYFSSKKVLVTGGLGFIGSTLARRLVDLGACVTVIDSLIPEYGGNLFNVSGYEDKVRINISDVRDPHSMRYLVQGQDILFNLAGQTSHMDSMQSPDTDLEINCRAQLSILEACKLWNRGIVTVFASTRQIYGAPDYLPVDERHPLRPVDVNGINKLAGEYYHILYNQVYGIRGCVLRLTNTYGPRMRIKDARQTFLGIWVRRAVEGEAFEIWGGAQRRDFTYVDDAVEAFLLAASREEVQGKVFNLGGEGVVTLRDLGDMVVDATGCGSYRLMAFPSDRKRIDIGDYYADYSAFNAAVGWRPSIALRDGIGRTIEYYRCHLSKYL